MKHLLTMYGTGIAIGFCLFVVFSAGHSDNTVAVGIGIVGGIIAMVFVNEEHQIAEAKKRLEEERKRHGWK